MTFVIEVVFKNPVRQDRHVTTSEQMAMAWLTALAHSTLVQAVSLKCEPEPELPALELDLDRVGNIIQGAADDRARED